MERENATMEPVMRNFRFNGVSIIGECPFCETSLYLTDDEENQDEPSISKCDVCGLRITVPVVRVKVVVWPLPDNWRY